MTGLALRVLHGSHIFFFQAEDGIRDRNVTGVQTCALPISPRTPTTTASLPIRATTAQLTRWSSLAMTAASSRLRMFPQWGTTPTHRESMAGCKIGRASCRERVEMWVAAGVVEDEQQEGAWV